jgi:hypothetical protein
MRQPSAAGRMSTRRNPAPFDLRLTPSAADPPSMRLGGLAPRLAAFRAAGNLSLVCAMRPQRQQQMMSAPLWREHILCSEGADRRDGRLADAERGSLSKGSRQESDQDPHPHARGSGRSQRQCAPVSIFDPINVLRVKRHHASRSPPMAGRALTTARRSPGRACRGAAINSGNKPLANVFSRASSSMSAFIDMAYAS